MTLDKSALCGGRPMSNRKINVTIYNEDYPDYHPEEVKEAYPNGIHGVLSEILEREDCLGKLRIATFETHREILTQEVLDDTDVLVWWSHKQQQEVDDRVVSMAALRVLRGMGFVALHSAHASKLFQKLMGTETYMLRWRVAGERARLWTVENNHPIAEGIPETFVVPHDETYGEPFGIPQPDELVFLSWFQGGEVFRSGCTWKRGEGKIFYFQNGHETYPVYYQPEVQRIFANAVKWASPVKRCCMVDRGGRNAPPMELANT
ncbi:ThuA domain-containing protein [Ruminococcaceae bacterium OttesenSCG-928-L11]|nr:ThuA domain-containing protein [Ruminococcaceae bacterium OttesenSCG-928-L11]